MKRLILISLSLLILMQSMRGYITYVSLKLNQDEIAANYCVNKNITICYGSCYIEKQLKALETETQKNPIKSINLKFESWLINQQIPTYTTLPALSFLYFSTNKPFYLPIEYNNSYLDDFFQPPQ